MSSDPSSLKGYRRIAPSSSAVVWAKIEAATPPEQRRTFSRVSTPRRALLLVSDDVARPIAKLDPDTQAAAIFPADRPASQSQACNAVEPRFLKLLPRVPTVR